MEPELSLVIECGVATLALPGQAESGDRHVVKAVPNGVLVAVVDGLGHGDEAALAAKTAVVMLERHAQESMISLMRRCHEGLRSTRGVVISMASFNALDGTVTWLGLGNVEGIVLRAESKAAPPYESLLLRGGVLGSQLPPLYASIIPIAKGDVLIFATDGIRSDFPHRLNLSDPPQRMADRILAQYAKGNDDALVLVARYVGYAHKEQSACTGG